MDVSPKAVILLNPRARRATGANWRRAVAALHSTYEQHVVVPDSASDATRLAREAARDGAGVVIAAGGDGTVNVVAAGLSGTAVPLGILPLGTANDLARELGIPRDPRAAAARIAGGLERRVDLVSVNGRTFCGVGGLVLVSASALAVTRFKERSNLRRRLANLLGHNVYRLSATAFLLGGRQIRQRLHIEYRDAATGAWATVDRSAHALFVANHGTLGGGLHLPIGASANDGVFELALVPERSRPSLLLNFSRLSAGMPLPEGVIQTHRATHAIVRTDHDDAFVADGDLLAVGREFELQILPGALSILV